MRRRLPRRRRAEAVFRRPATGPAAGPTQHVGSGDEQAEGGQVVHLGLLQTHASTDAQSNLARTLALTERAARQGAQIICTQELFRSQYFCQS